MPVSVYCSSPTGPMWRSWGFIPHSGLLSPDSMSRDSHSRLRQLGYVCALPAGHELAIMFSKSRARPLHLVDPLSPRGRFTDPGMVSLQRRSAWARLVAGLAAHRIVSHRRRSCRRGLIASAGYLRGHPAVPGSPAEVTTCCRLSVWKRFCQPGSNRQADGMRWCSPPQAGARNICAGAMSRGVLMMAHPVVLPSGPSVFIALLEALSHADCAAKDRAAIMELAARLQQAPEDDTVEARVAPQGLLCIPTWLGGRRKMVGTAIAPLTLKVARQSCPMFFQRRVERRHVCFCPRALCRRLCVSA